MTIEVDNVKYALIPIEGNKDYFVSEDGIVYSNKRNRTMRYRINSDGYWGQMITINGKCVSVANHRLVALAFIKNELGKKYVNHKDGVKSNNHYSNLEWVTPSENILHSYRTGLKTNKGDKHPCRKLHSTDFPKIKELHKNKHTYNSIGRIYGVGGGTISKIIRGLSWV